MEYITRERERERKGEHLVRERKGEHLVFSHATQYTPLA